MYHGVIEWEAKFSVGVSWRQDDLRIFIWPAITYKKERMDVFFHLFRPRQ